MTSAPKISSVHFGKVRDSATLSDSTRIVRTSDRISAFDMMMPFTIPEKGACLQEISLQAFQETADILPNHFLGILDAQTILVQNLNIIPIEMILRRFLTGSLWRLYRSEGPEGVRRAYGVELPEGMCEHQAFPQPVFTPTTKAKEGHDLPLPQNLLEPTLEEFLRNKEKSGLTLGRKAAELSKEIQEKLLALFLRGEEQAKKRELILVDTKYELGLDESGGLVLADEIHTPDSSRYWRSLPQEGVVKQLSKEFLREELMRADIVHDNSLTADGEEDLRKLAPQLAQRTAERYQELRDLFLGSAATHTPQQRVWPVPITSFEAAIEPAQICRNLLVVGSGGRDHSLLSRFALLPSVQSAWIHPAQRNWSARQLRAQTLSADNFETLAKRALEKDIDLVLVGPEAPIAQGVAEAFAQQKIPCLAPSPAVASLEASKILCKQALREAGVPTAESRVMTLSEVLAASEPPFLPCVLKYDGLAGGKGVFVVRTAGEWTEAQRETERQAPSWHKAMKNLTAPSASADSEEALFLLEECVDGQEYSLTALCNGSDFRLLPLARDYKRRNNDQTGPNTGGMGTVAPVDVHPKLLSQFKFALGALLKHQVKRGQPFNGPIFMGFMVNKNQQAYVLEINCRLGDPEAQVILPGLGDDFLLECVRTAQGKDFFWPEKSGEAFEHDGLNRVFVVAASPEYPHSSPPARMVRRLGSNNISCTDPQCVLIPSAIEPDGRTRGGRAFGILATDTSVPAARRRAYRELAEYRLDAEKPYFRTDIGQEWESKP